MCMCGAYVHVCVPSADACVCTCIHLMYEDACMKICVCVRMCVVHVHEDMYIICVCFMNT